MTLVTTASIVLALVVLTGLVWRWAWWRCLVPAGLEDRELPANECDVALLVTVLGEIPDELAALREIHQSLRPGGVLSITEVLPHPYYQGVSRVRTLVGDSGFRELSIFRGWSSCTLNVSKPAAG